MTDPLPVLDVAASIRGSVRLGRPVAVDRAPQPDRRRYLDAPVDWSRRSSLLHCRDLEDRVSAVLDAAGLV